MRASSIGAALLAASLVVAWLPDAVFVATVAATTGIGVAISMT